MLILTEVNINEIYEDIILVNIAFYIPMGSFNNHMDMILHLLPPAPLREHILLFTWTKMSWFWTAPPLVHVVIE